MQLKYKIFWNLKLGYWIVQAILLFGIKGYGLLPVITAITIILLCIYAFFCSNSRNRMILSLLFIAYSVLFAFIAIISSVFIHDILIKTMFFMITIVNFIISISMFVDVKKYLNH